MHSVARTPIIRDMESLRILIADDESIIRMDLRQILESMEHEIAGEASDGERALKLARVLKPDLCILDIKMPKLTGLEVAEALTKEGIAPVILLTAFTDKKFILKAKDAGVYAYIVKPFSEKDILPAIEMAVSKFQEICLLHKELESAKDDLKTRKVVERAKGLFMDKYGLKEDDAYEKLRKQAMNKRKTLKEVAEAFLLSEEMK